MTFEPKIQALLNRLTNYWRDKRLAEKCGMTVQDICEHEQDGNIYWDDERFPAKYCCKKCSAWKEEMR